MIPNAMDFAFVALLLLVFLAGAYSPHAAADHYGSTARGFGGLEAARGAPVPEGAGRTERAERSERAEGGASSDPLQDLMPSNVVVQTSASFDDGSTWLQGGGSDGPQLKSLMPSSWRGGGTDKGGDAAFSKHSVDPERVLRSQRSMGLVRLPQSSRGSMGRSLGQTSILREAVTPLSAIPVGGSVFFSNDSEARLARAVEINGSYPEKLCC
jgi:hypothetical protein